jgi:hypothetical protein
MSKLPIPWYGSGKRYDTDKEFDGFRMAVRVAADKANVSQIELALLASHLFEEIMHVVANGDQVIVPGFGGWFPVLRETKSNPEGFKRIVRPVIYFCPKRSWRSYVATNCPRAFAERGEVKYRSYRKINTFHSPESNKKLERAIDMFPSLWRRKLRKDMVERTTRTYA